MRHVLGFFLLAFALLQPVAVHALEAPLSKIEPLTVATESDAFMFTV